ncbi:MAG: hypothetical protein EAZ81_11460 [Verrucomicrobia bacterium]|nr:MAG: hypothetical protein EAZ81_11460 [Verrucomicrobiota bacterium]
MNDEELHILLCKHPVKTFLPSTYHREVWSRIESCEQRRAKSQVAYLARRLLLSLSNPAAAFVIIASFGAVGAGAGVLMYQKTHDSIGELAYLETVNPLVRTHSEEEP